LTFILSFATSTFHFFGRPEEGGVDCGCILEQEARKLVNLLQFWIYRIEPVFIEKYDNEAGEGGS